MTTQAVEQSAKKKRKPAYPKELVYDLHFTVGSKKEKDAIEDMIDSLFYDVSMLGVEREPRRGW